MIAIPVGFAIVSGWLGVGQVVDAIDDDNKDPLGSWLLVGACSVCFLMSACVAWMVYVRS